MKSNKKYIEKPKFKVGDIISNNLGHKFSRRIKWVWINFEDTGKVKYFYDIALNQPHNHLKEWEPEWQFGGMCSQGHLIQWQKDNV